jgi:hypothetical protein
VIAKQRKNIMWGKTSSFNHIYSQSYKTFFLRIPIFAIKLVCLLHIEKLIYNKIDLALQPKWKNSLLAKKKRFIASATGFQKVIFLPLSNHFVLDLARKPQMKNRCYKFGFAHSNPL